MSTGMSLRPSTTESLSARLRQESRAQAMRQLMEEDVIEVGVEGEKREQRRIEDTQSDRTSALLELGVHHVFQQDLLGAFLLADRLVVGKIEGRGLHTTPRVAGGVELLHDLDRRFVAPIEVLVLLRFGEIALHVRQGMSVRGELGALGSVDDG